MLLAPAFLLGLLAIGVPLWLHRMARATPPQHPFASLMLLEASETQRAAQRTLRYWLLLAARILLVALLALAFAEPFITARLLPVAASETRLHAIVLDTSLSMQYGDRWQRALQAAEQVLDELRSSDRVMLATAAGRRVEIVHDAVFASEAGEVRARLRSLAPGVQRLDYGLAMSTAEGWLGSPRPPAWLHLISDLQQSAAPLRFADLEPPGNTQLVLHDIGDGSTENAFVAHAGLVAGDTRTLEVTVRSTAATSQRREVLLTIDGRVHGRRSIEVPAAEVRERVRMGEGDTLGTPYENLSGGKLPAPETTLREASATVRFAELDLEPGTHRIEVALEPADLLPQDDRYYAVIEHADPKALLLARDPQADDTAYFAAAIGSLTTPRLGVEQLPAAAAHSTALGQYSMIVVTDLEALPSADAARLNDYLAGGGSVLATLGAANTASPLLEGWRLGEVRERASRVGEIATTHPVLREAGEWHRVRFHRRRTVEIAEDDRVLIAYQDGAPLLIERVIGAGRMLVLTAPMARDWNDLAIHPLFVRFILEAARYLVGTDAAAASATAGGAVMTGLTAADGGQIFDPQGERVLRLGQTSAADRLVPDRTGFYEVRGTEGVRWLAVNVDARESDLAPLPAPFIERWLALRRQDARAAAREAPAQPVATSRSLGPALLWLAAAVLLLEMLLANRHLTIRREMPR